MRNNLEFCFFIGKIWKKTFGIRKQQQFEA